MDLLYLIPLVLLLWHIGCVILVFMVILKDRKAMTRTPPSKLSVCTPARNELDSHDRTISCCMHSPLRWRACPLRCC